MRPRPPGSTTLARAASVLLLVAVSTLASTTTASAHVEPAFLDPADGLELIEPPERVRTFFREPVEGEFLRVHDERGERVDEGDARVTGPIDDPDIDIAEEAVYSVGLRPLPSGTYTVEYSVRGEDGHAHGHSYRFHVLGAGDGGWPTTGAPSGAAHEGHAAHEAHDHDAKHEGGEVPETGGPSVGHWLVLASALAILFGASVWFALWRGSIPRY